MPSSSVSWLGAALAAWPQGRYEIASMALESTLRAIPIRDSEDMRAAVEHYESEDWAAAERAFAKVIGQMPEDTPAYVFLALVLVRLNRPDEALTAVERAHTLELPDSE